MNEESQLTCHICRKSFGLQFEFELIGETNKVCFFCILEIKKIRTQINQMKNMKIELYGKSIQVTIDPIEIINILKYIQCRICLKVTVCCKVCNDDHYFCLDCLDKFFQEQQLNQRKIQCPQQNCDQSVGHYIITMFMKQGKGQFQKWNALRYNLFCPKKNCQDRIRIPPFGNLETQIIKIDNEQSKCSTCQIKICNICWTEFKGNYHQHQNKCNSEKFRNELFYQLEQDIAQCPKCKCYSSYDCRIKAQQVQQCQLCETKFCIFCKTANLELFFMRKPFHYACNCYENFCNRTNLKQLIGLFLLLLISPIWLIILAGYFLTNQVKLKASQIIFPYKQVCYYIFFPLILIFWAIYYFFYISLKISFRIFVFYHVMLGIWEDWNNYLKIFDDK